MIDQTPTRLLGSLLVINPETRMAVAERHQYFKTVEQSEATGILILSSIALNHKTSKALIWRTMPAPTSLDQQPEPQQ